MENNNFNISDDDDLRLFESLNLASEIIRIKHNDPEVTRLIVRGVRDLDERAWRRLGHILGQNTNVENFQIWNSTLDVAALCAGLQNN